MIRWIHVFIDVPAERAPDTERFWSSVTGWPTGRRWDNHPEFVTLEPTSGAAYAHVQTIGGPPRVHLDLVVDAGTSVDTERERIEGLGATASPGRQPGMFRQVAASRGPRSSCSAGSERWWS